MSIHYNNALNPELFKIPACRPNAANLKVTTDRTKVTCKNCQQRLGLRGDK